MNKLSILLLGLALTLVSGACDNLLLTTLDIASVGSAAVTPTALTKCTSLTSICCVEADINAFQTIIQTKLTDLATAVTTRDTNLLAARAALALASTNLTLFKAAATAAATNLATMITAPVTNAQDVSDHAVKFSGYVTDVITNYATIRTAFDTYQTARQTCVQGIMKVQANLYCLACEADPSLNGADGTTGEIELSTTTIDDLLADCYPYLVSSDAQNVIFKLNTQIDNIDALTAALVLIAANDNTGVAAYYALSSNPDTSNTIAQKPTGTCTATDCDWISTTLLPVSGLVDATLLNLGGEVATRRRILEEARLLVAWTPVDSGVTVTFAKDPSGLGNPVDPMSAVIRNGVISCIAAVFLTLLI